MTSYTINMKAVDSPETSDCHCREDLNFREDFDFEAKFPYSDHLKG